MKLIANSDNLGFAKGCNQGLAASDGDTVLFLNNDTVVTPHWLARMLGVLHSADDIGMVGPATNYASGQQQLAVPYVQVSEADDFSKEHARRFSGYSFDTRRIVGFCMLLKRSVLDETGGFDERYGLGNFEDDDLCLRVMLQGYRLRIVYDSYIHHFGHMTTNSLPDANLGSLLQINREKAKLKWGRDIHELIYRELPEVTLVLPLDARESPAGEALTSSTSAIRRAANELVIVDCGADRATLEQAAALTDLIVDAVGLTPEEWWPSVVSRATKDYLWWMSPNETLSAADCRKMAGTRLALPDGTEAVSMLLRMENAAYAGNEPSVVRTTRWVKRDSAFGWNPFVRDFLPAPGAKSYRSDVTIRPRSTDRFGSA